MLRHEAFAPVEQLPIEILAEVFVQLFLQRADTGAGNKPSPHGAPLLLARVCRSWRAIAESTPKLWSRYDISFGEARPGLDLLQLWLNRSRGYPLFLSMHWLSEYHDGVSLDEVLSYVHAFECFASQWQHVSLYLGDLSLGPCLSRGASPHLRTLYLSPSSFPTMESLPFTSTPVLERLDWTLPAGALSTNTVSWHCLKHVTLYGKLSLEDVYELFRVCPCLVTSNLTSTDDSRQQNGPALPSIVLRHHVQDFTLTAYNDISPLLDCLELSSLQSFRVRSYSHHHYMLIVNGDSVFQGTLSLLKRSQCKLRSIFLHEYMLRSEQVLELLEVTGALLEKLSISNSYHCPGVTDEILQRLTYDPSPGAPLCFAPKLNTLHLDLCIECTEGLLADMVESRCAPQHADNMNRPVAFLANIEFFLSKELAQDTYRIVKLMNHGVDVGIDVDRPEEVCPHSNLRGRVSLKMPLQE